MTKIFKVTMIGIKFIKYFVCYGLLAILIIVIFTRFAGIWSNVKE